MESNRRQLMAALWNKYIEEIQFYSLLFPRGTIWDHLAIIDVGLEGSNRNTLISLFKKLGFEERGSGYIPDKINDFMWMAEPNIDEKLPSEALPQIVLADFRIDELSKANRDLVHSYLKKVDQQSLPSCDAGVRDVSELVDYLNMRPWPLMTVREYMMLRDENPLLSWVMASGRKVNHFGVSIHLDGRFNSLADFNESLRRVAPLNFKDGAIKGSLEMGIEQSSSVGSLQRIMLRDGEVELNRAFMEFVWRQQIAQGEAPRWGDYYTGFLATNATNIIESVIIKRHAVG